MEINTKDVKLVKTNISSLHSFEMKRRNIGFYQFYIFGINFHNNCTSGYSLYNQIVWPK